MLNGICNVTLLMKVIVPSVLLLLFYVSWFATRPSSGNPAGVTTPSWSLLESTRHDNSCFTQGFLFLDANTAIESCGLYGKSKVQVVDFTAYNANKSSPPRVLKSAPLSPRLFAEGIALAKGELYVLTWQENVVLVIDPYSLAMKRTISYPLEGWGIEYRNSTDSFLATDGSNNIYHLDPIQLKVFRTVPVICNGRAINNLNELELVGNDLFANVWLSNVIYRINPDTGACLSVYVLSGLKKGSGDVLNGIASPIGIQSRPGSHTFWVTGKLWEYLHRIEIFF